VLNLAASAVGARLDPAWRMQRPSAPVLRRRARAAAPVVVGLILFGLLGGVPVAIKA